MARATRHPKLKKVKLKLKRPVSDKSIHAHKKNNDAAVAVAVAASASVPDFAKAGQVVQHMVSSMDEQAKKRKQEEAVQQMKKKAKKWRIGLDEPLSHFARGAPVDKDKKKIRRSGRRRTRRKTSHR